MSTEPHGIADDQVRSAFQRWKNLEEEKARIGDDLKELFAEQKACGHDTKAMRAAFRLKVKLDEADPADAEHEALVDTYLAALSAPSRASRAYAREDRSDAGLNILTKHEDIRTAPVTAEEAEPEAAAEVAGNDLREPVAAEQGQIIREGDAPRETDRLGGDASRPDTDQPGTATELSDALEPTRGEHQAIASSEHGRSHGQAAGRTPESQTDGIETVTAGETATISPEEAEEGFPSAEREDRAAANAGGDDVNGGAERATQNNTVLSTGEGAANTALPAKPKPRLRPNCLDRSNCKSGSVDHCWSCKKAMAEKSEVAA